MATTPGRRQQANSPRPRPRPARIPLSLAQRGLWILHQLDPTDTSYHTLFAYRLAGDVDDEALAAAVRDVVERHEALRTSFPGHEDGEPSQSVQPPASIPVTRHVVSAEPDPAAAARAIVDRYQLTPYDLTSMPPARCGVIRVRNDETILVIGTHHLVLDAASSAVLLRDLDRAYRNRTAGSTAVPPPPLPVQYADVALWQYDLVAQGAFQSSRDYWREHLEGYRGPTDLRSLNPVKGVWGTTCEVVIDLSPALSERLRAAAAEVHTTLFMLLFAAWAAVLADLTTHTPGTLADVVIGVPVDRRTDRALRDLVGMFVSMIPVRVRPRARQTFSELLTAVRDALLDGYVHADVPLEWIARDRAPGSTAGRSPLVEFSCQLQYADGAAVTIGRHLAEPVKPAPQQAKFQLSLSALSSAAGTRLHLSYPGDRFARNAVDALARQLNAVLEHVAADLGAVLSDLPPLEAVETEGLAVVENDIAAMFAEVVGHDVGVTDAFFDVGGHSLLAVQLMRRLRERYGDHLGLNLLLTHPTARALAAAIAGGTYVEAPAPQPDFVHDVGCWLPPLPKRAPNRPTHVLVTGATGLMGSHVVAELLENTSVAVLCIVRSGSDEAARQRVVAALRGTGRWRREWEGRLRVLRGDVAAPRMGLSEEEYTVAADTVDTVLHTAASTHLLETYAGSRRSNVLGTREVLWFATTGQLKAIHHVSTASIMRGGPDAPETLPEDWCTHPAHLGPDGYLRSKWVAEQTVLQAARLGVPVLVYRPSRIAGDAATGVASASDGFWTLVIACVEAGAEPTGAEWDGFGDRLVPVNHLARTFVRLALGTPVDGSAHTLTNPVRTTLVEVLKVARSLGYRVERVDGDTWVKRIEAAVQDPARRSPALESARLLIEAARRDRAGEARPVSTGSTDAALAAAGLDACPPLDAPFFRRCLRRFAERGALPPPPSAASARTRRRPETGSVPGLWALWEQVVRTGPRRVAAVDDHETIDVAELDQRAAEVAAALHARGVRQGDRVGVRLRHEVCLLAVLLGIVRIGAAFVPVDHREGDVRARRLLATAGVRLTVSHVDPDDGDTVSPDALAREGSGRPVPEPRMGDAAYVLFTSGSTGEPKGVVIPHGALGHYLAWVRTEYAGGRPRGAPVYSSIAFDLTITSLFGPLVSGGAVRLVPPGDGILGVAELLRDGSSFDFVKLTPTHLRLLLDELGEQEPRGHVAALVVGGEALPPDLVEAWRRISPGTVIHNEYGPTEATVGCCVYRLDPGVEVPCPYPIGTPIPGTEVSVRDGHDRPVSPGEQGELFIGGRALAWGYAERPAETARRFVPDPAAKGGRLYRTGDVVTCRPADGVLLFHGREDNQVKVRGHRIELGEIEVAFRRLPDVRDCVARPVTSGGDIRIVVYVVPDDPERGVAPDLRARVRERLPEYMVPTEIHFMEAVPMTTNGKVDVARLPTPDRPGRVQTRPDGMRGPGLRSP